MDNLEEKILREVQPSKTEQGRNRECKQTNHKYWNSDLTISNIQKSRTRWFHRWILSNREALLPINLKVFQKIAEEETLPSLFYEATITLIAKSDKDSPKKEITGQCHWRT